MNKNEMEQTVKKAYNYVDKEDNPNGLLSESHIWNLISVIELKDKEIRNLKESEEQRITELQNLNDQLTRLSKRLIELQDKEEVVTVQGYQLEDITEEMRNILNKTSDELEVSKV